MVYVCACVCYSVCVIVYVCVCLVAQLVAWFGDDFAAAVQEVFVNVAC
jgi:hypothetical protein